MCFNTLMLRVAWRYALWHYTHALEGYMRVWFTLVWGVYHLFSIPFLLRTLFSPIMRTQEYYTKGFNPQQWAETFVVNSVMRVVGLFARLVVIAIGCGVLSAVFVAGAIGLLVWLLWPAVLAGLFGGGIVLVMMGLRQLVVR